MSKASPSVAFVMRHVHHYREPFYRGLRDDLKERGIHFDLLHGDPSPLEQVKRDAVYPEWALHRRNRVLRARGQELILQPVFREVAGYDLVIVEQASRLLVNYALVGRRALGRGPLLAMSGHGANLASDPSAVGERLKSAYSQRADWFFGYTSGTRDRLVAAGFPSDRITVFDNTLDLSALRGHLSSIDDEEVEDYKASLDLAGRSVVLVLGSLYPDKRPDLTVDVADALAGLADDVGVLAIGSGPSSEMVSGAAATRPNLVHLEAAFDRAKALALKAADIMLVPGVAGLIVLDAFAAGLPLVTARNPHHPPEIDYLEDGVNSVILPDPDADSFAAEIVRLLGDDDRRTALGRAASDAGEFLTTANMVNKFADGVERALTLRPS